MVVGFNQPSLFRFRPTSLCSGNWISSNELCSEYSDYIHMLIKYVTSEEIITGGECMSQTIIRCLEDMGLDVSKIRGQAYGGASAMSSKLVGVQAKIREVAPKALYTHCSGHCLNLVLASS